MKGEVKIFVLCDNCLDSRQSFQGYRLNHAFQVFFHEYGNEVLKHETTKISIPLIQEKKIVIFHHFCSSIPPPLIKILTLSCGSILKPFIMCSYEKLINA